MRNRANEEKKKKKKKVENQEKPPSFSLPLLSSSLSLFSLSSSLSLFSLSSSLSHFSLSSSLHSHLDILHRCHDVRDVPLGRRVVPRLAARPAEAPVVDDKGRQPALGGEGRGELVQAHLLLGADAVGHHDDGGPRGGAVEGALWGVEPGLSLFWDFLLFCWLRGSRWGE